MKLARWSKISVVIVAIAAILSVVLLLPHHGTDRFWFMRLWFRSWFLHVRPVIADIAVSADHSNVAVLVFKKHRFRDFDNSLFILDLRNSHVTDLGLHPVGAVDPLAWSPDGSLLAYLGAGTPDFSLHIVEPRTRRDRLVATGLVDRLKFAPSGHSLGFLRDHKLSIQDLASDKTIATVDGVMDWSWLRAKDDVLLSKDGAVFRLALPGDRSQLLFQPPRSSTEDEDFGFRYFTLSPDPAIVGLYVDSNKTFYALDLSRSSVTPLFRCDHYFLGFDWNEDGIVYLNHLGGERRKMARLMVFDPATMASREIATGSFSSPRWIGRGRIIVVKGRAQLEVYDLVAKHHSVVCDLRNENS
jgi:hypothetical protein